MEINRKRIVNTSRNIKTTLNSMKHTEKYKIIEKHVENMSKHEQTLKHIKNIENHENIKKHRTHIEHFWKL